VWKSIPSKNVNYDKFLEYQGVPYMKRAVASRTSIVHSIEHEGDQFKLEVRLRGPVKTCPSRGSYHRDPGI
jgi:hypothetical protein